MQSLGKKTQHEKSTIYRIKDLNELLASIELGYQNGEDPVSDFELSRNSKIYNIQSNRNPFIDHPELADVLFS